MTRWDSARKPSARLDYAIAIGADASRWELISEREPWVGKSWVSDHALITVGLRVRCNTRALGDRRPMPFPLAGRRTDKLVKERYGTKL